MNKVKGLGVILSLACFLALTGTFQAQDQKPKAEKHDAALLREALKDVINVGADLFNKYGDHAGCYRLYQGALLSIKPFLAPGMQKEIDSAVAEAEKLPRFSDRAFALRKTIDSIRSQANPDKKAEEQNK